MEAIKQVLELVLFFEIPVFGVTFRLIYFVFIAMVIPILRYLLGLGGESE